MRLKHQLERMRRSQPSQRTMLGLLFLMAAGYLGNFTRWTLFFDIDFIFGSIAVWIVVCLYGIRAGTLAGLVAASCTYFLWRHPYSVITFTLEALFVGWLFHKKRQNIVLLDGIYWLLVGVPLIWLFYGVVLQVDPVQVSMIGLKQPINGIFNALIASLLLTYLPIHRWLQRPPVINSLSFQQTLFNLLVAFVFLPTLLLVIVGSRDVVNTIRNTAQTNLNSATISTSTEIRAWYQQRLRAVSELAQTAATDLPPAELRSSLELTQRLLPDIVSLTTIAADGTTVLTHSNGGVLSAAATRTNRSELELARQTQQPTVSDVFSSPGNQAGVVVSAPIVQEQVSGFVVGEVQLNSVDALLKTHAEQQRVHITLVGRNHTVIASTQTHLSLGQRYDRRQDGDLHWLESQTYQWFPQQGNQLVMVRWMNSFFVRETAIAADLPWTLIVEDSAQPDTRSIQRIYTRNLAIILTIALLALVIAVALSRQLVRPVSQLAQLTTNLPEKLLTGEPIDWIDSQVMELAALIGNFRRMSTTLTQKFREIQQVSDYEALLKRITDKVRDSLDEAQILQTVVWELGQGLDVICCDAAIYNAEHTTSTICYEYTTSLPAAAGRVLPIPVSLPAVYAELLAGNYCQFSPAVPQPVRPLHQQTTILACAIVDDQSPLGDLWLYKSQGKVFHTPEVRLVQQIANHCAIAIRQARLYQAAQIQVRALEELNQLKDDFLSTVSHELRTPITNMKMAIKLLRLSKTEEQSDRYLQILQAECDREAELINDLLDLQRLTAGTQTLDLEPIHLQEWVDQIAQSFQARTQTRQQTLQIDISTELPVILSDSACLSRIVNELLNNACKYTPPGELIQLSARMVTEQAAIPTKELSDLALPHLASLVVLDVCNSGVEIPADRLPHIFEKFYRVPGIDRWKQGGTGLGLALVQKMTQHLGGTIQVESGANQTCFTLKLPVTVLVA